MQDTIEKWLLWRLPALATWAGFIAAAIRVIDNSILSPYSLLAFTWPFAAFSVHVARSIMSKKLKFIWFVLYIPFSPFIVGYAIVDTGYRTASRLGKIMIFASHDLVSPFYTIVSIALSLVIFQLHSHAAITVLYILLVAIHAMMLFCMLRWALEPGRPIVVLLRIALWLSTKGELTSLDKAGIEAIKKERASLLKMSSKMIPFLRLFKPENLRRTLSIYFFTDFVLLFLLFSFEYTMVYTAVLQTDPNSISKLSSREPDCVLYSISVLSTCPIGGIEPISDLARFVYTMQSATAVMLITLYISCFAIGVSVDEANSKMIHSILADLSNVMKGKIDHYEKEISRHLAQVDSTELSTPS